MLFRQVPFHYQEARIEIGETRIANQIILSTLAVQLEEVDLSALDGFEEVNDIDGQYFVGSVARN